MDFSAFKAPEIANKRREGGLPPKVQEFADLKYRKAPSKKGGVIGKFHLAKERIEAINLKELALRHFIHPTDKTIVLLGTVADENGKYLRKREGKEKGDAFKSDALEAALAAAGVIDANALKTNQFIAMTKVGEGVTIDGMTVFQVYQLSKGEKKTPVARVEQPVAETPVGQPATVASTPVATAPATAAPAAAASTDEWN